MTFSSISTSCYVFCLGFVVNFFFHKGVVYFSATHMKFGHVVQSNNQQSRLTGMFAK